MARTFNITGLCIPQKHFMGDWSDKLNKVMKMVTHGDYFTINRPRQYGKTTMIYLLEQRLVKDKNYLVLGISFEEIDAATYEKHELFISTFLEILRDQLVHLQEEELITLIDEKKAIDNFKQLTTFLNQIIDRAKRKVVLIIDEVDKACNNQLFLDFLGMLRAKYLRRNQGKGSAFHSVILTGVHDVKTLKLKIRKEESRIYNSPWNIAVDFEVELRLFPVEIASMLQEYVNEKKILIDISYFAEKLFYYTSGYPFLVSYLCKIIDEKILPGKEKKEWEPQDLTHAIQMALGENNTNFESLIKNLENDTELYELVFHIVMNEKEFSYNLDNPIINLGAIYGILLGENGKTKIHNRIYEQRIYNYLASKMETSGEIKFDHVSSSFFEPDGGLNLEKAIKKFQGFMKEQYSTKDFGFIERNGKLLFLTFIRPIINGKGFDFKEIQISEEKRLDIVITFGNNRYVIELKIWRGESYHQKGINQLCDYLDRENEKSGYLLIFDLRKEKGKTGHWEKIKKEDKEIFTAWI